MAGRILADEIYREPLWLALSVLAVAAIAILAALGFEHLGGYQPCALCLMQRTPYYLGIPIAAVAALAIWMRAPRPVVMGLFTAVAVLFLYNAGLAAYHAGVEWRFWEGPASCAGSVGVGNAADMLNQLQNMHAPSCTEASWRFAGLSFAGWNVLVSALIAGLAAAGAWATRRQADYGSSTASQYR
jgi:disulfide bond formation protein DsbB